MRQEGGGPAEVPVSGSLNGIEDTWPNQGSLYQREGRALPTEDKENISSNKGWGSNLSLEGGLRGDRSSISASMLLLISALGA